MLTFFAVLESTNLTVSFQHKIFKLGKMLCAHVSEFEGYVVYMTAVKIADAVASSARMTSSSRLIELSSTARANLLGNGFMIKQQRHLSLMFKSCSQLLSPMHQELCSYKSAPESVPRAFLSNSYSLLLRLYKSATLSFS